MKRLLSTARHEAAHAVVASYLGLPVTRTWIEPDGCGWTSYDQRFHPPTLSRAVVCMAGSVADHIWQRIHVRYVSVGDADFLRKALGIRQNDWWMLRHLTRRVVLQHQRAIHAVAYALQRRDLRGAEVRALIREFGRHPLPKGT